MLFICSKEKMRAKIRNLIIFHRGYYLISKSVKHFSSEEHYFHLFCVIKTEKLTIYRKYRAKSKIAIIFVHFTWNRCLSKHVDFSWKGFFEYFVYLHPIKTNIHKCGSKTKKMSYIKKWFQLYFKRYKHFFFGNWIFSQKPKINVMRFQFEPICGLWKLFNY